MKNIDVTGCIVLYKNDRAILGRAISSFLNTKLNVRLYLIDNSPDTNLHDISLDERVSYFPNPSNPGFGAGHNLAIKEVLKEDCKYHLVLNPDIYYDDDILVDILDYMNDHPDVGNLMPKVLYPDGAIQYLCKLLPTPYDWIGRRFNPFKSLVDKRNNLFELRFTNYDKLMEVPYLSGCFMFLRLSAIKDAGLFDEKIFMYGEETDLCRRIIACGFKTVFFPKVSVVHYFAKGSHKSFRLTWIGIKSALYYFNKWGWLFDKERRDFNRNTLEKLGYK